MRRCLHLLGLFCALAILIAVANAQKGSKEPADILEGVLRIHPKFHYRYYIDGFGSGQNCALFKADERLADVEPGTRIRVRGDLRSQFFGTPP